MENVITISIEEYKDLIRVAVEKEFHEQIVGMQKQIDDMEAEFAEQRKSLEKDSMYWFKRWEAENKKADELKEELDFYKPAKQEEAS